MQRRYCKHVMCRTCMQQCSHIVSVCHASVVRGCVPELIIQSYLPLLVSQTPSPGSNASPPPALLMQLSFPSKLHVCEQIIIFYIFIFIFCSMYLILFLIVLYRTIVTVYTDNIFLYNYLWQMHQIIHLSPLGCFTPARRETLQKNSGVKQMNQ